MHVAPVVVALVTKRAYENPLCLSPYRTPRTRVEMHEGAITEMGIVSPSEMREELMRALKNAQNLDTTWDNPSWDALTDAEPKLQHLHNEALLLARQGQQASSFCGTDAWYGYNGHVGFKRRLQRLVGRGLLFEDQLPTPGFLATEEAYALAYRTLESLIPPCSNCHHTTDS